MSDPEPKSPAAFPALAFDANAKFPRPLRVCIASFDFVGPVRNGGVGTAFTSLGEALAAAGHEVTLLFLGGRWCENRTLEYWVDYYAKKGIKFVPMPECGLTLEAPWHVAKAYEAHLWLKDQGFDVIHFSEWKGPGFFCLNAKRQGLAFERTLLCVHTHGPTLWHKLSNGEYVTSSGDAQMDYLERSSVRLAEVLVSPSRYLLRWMRERNWTLPENTFVQPYVRPATARKPLPGADRLHEIKELVFFGRLEIRKGLVLFCDALDQLKDVPELSHTKITFLGKADKVGNQGSADYLAARAKQWPWSFQVISDRDQAGAMDYLQGAGRLAVLPSLVDNLPNTVLECLGAKIPFIASDAGGIPEMIAATDLGATCFPLNAGAFAEKLRHVLLNGIRPAAPAWDSQENERAWVKWHESHAASQTGTLLGSSPELSVSQPFVSVCLSHWNRPHYLKQALASIEAMDYQNYEVVLVDDGSTEPGAVQFIEELAPQFARRNWQLLRNPRNLYPGAARNLAARHARGEYIMFMDDDNCAKPHELSTFVKVARKTNADILTCCLDTFSGTAAPPAGMRPRSRWVFVGDDAVTGAFRNCFGDTNSLMRREVFLQLGGFHEDWGVGHEDWELFAKAVLKGYRLEVVPEALAWYRLNETETTVNRKTPLHRNHMANIRPYLDAVPAALRNLVYLAQGLEMTTAQPQARSAAGEAEQKLRVNWQAKIEASRVFARLNQKKPAIDLLMEAIKLVEHAKHPVMLFETLIAAGVEMQALDAQRSEQIFQIALQLAKALKNPVLQQTATGYIRPPAKQLKPEQTPAPAAATPARISKPQKGAAPESVVVSIVIPAFNRLDLTNDCLRSLRANTQLTTCEIIVVDNASTDGTADFLASQQRAGLIRAIINRENLGFAHACNQGAAAARGKFVLFLNNDTEVRPNWLEPLLRIAETDPRVGALGPKLVFPDSTIQHAGIVILDDRKHNDPLLAQHVFHRQPQDLAEANKVKTYQALTAACLLVRRDVFNGIGGFDEEFWNGYEDVDLCFRIRQAGRLLVYQPASVVVHHESQSGPERFRKAPQNIALLHKKWLNIVRPDFIVSADGEVAKGDADCIRDYACPSVAQTERPCTASIIVLAHNQLEHTRACLESIEANTKLPHEIIVVDNGSTEATQQFLKSWCAAQPDRIVIRNQSNHGFAAGNNQALSIARGSHVVLLNNDTVVTRGWLENMLNVFTQHPEAGVTGPMSNRVSGPQCVRDVSYRNLSELPAFAAEWSREHRGQSFEAGRAVGFCLMARREVIEHIGGLEEKFGPGNFEDDDFCIRAQIAGFKIRIAKDAFVHHTGSQTFKAARIDYHKTMLANWQIFKTKWQLPEHVTLESGYPVPKNLPEGLPLSLALPTLSQTHKKSGDRFWIEQTATPAAAQSEVPLAARVGSLDEARARFGRRDLPGAWNATIAALQARPFHPEALMLLAEIALLAGDGNCARKCAEHARALAPNWSAPRQFLKKPLKGGAALDWLLPGSIFSGAKSPRLTVCVIARNEEKFLGQCLASIRGLAHQIILVDTGSTDRTVEIAREHGADVHASAWREDFSAARNAALERATGDWILMLDADEELPPDQHARLIEDAKHPEVIALRLPLINRGLEAEGPSYVPRFFRNAPGICFYGRIHEQVFPSLVVLAKAWGLKTGFGSARIAHHGYSAEMVRERNKIERNLRLLRLALAENPTDANLVMNLGLELVRSGDLPGGLARYREAYRLLSAQKPSEVVPELREALLSQFTTQLYKLREHAEVARVLTSPLAKNGGLTASLHFALGLSHFELKNFPESAEQMRQCLAKRRQSALTPINVDIATSAPHHCLALCQARMGDFDGAEKSFQAALQEPGRREDVKLDYARFLAAQSRQLDALRRLHEMVSQNASHAAAWRLGAEIALSQPEFLEFARDWSGEAMRYVAGDIAIVAQRAEALMFSGDTASARDLWERICQTEAQPRALAALILCETIEFEAPRAPVDPAQETSASHEFIAWYRRMIQMRQGAVIAKLNARMQRIAGKLPTAGGMIEKALHEAEISRPASACA